ncbi:hypothetical protein MATL_G00178530 [Megalops atlanticus]|uniref:Uncharacterized protein n=1 Tax=Megalops atlanticus TaxID=7932 RepID=A0A9D3PRT0_MEGAT|nr:hypothetical protein MATL_G00178530 [Megalops atlanticus]
MGLKSLILLMSAVFLSTVAVAAGEECRDYKVQFERVFTVPEEAAVLNCTLASPDVFDLSSTSYNISWYEQRTGRELSTGAGRIWARETMLWFLNSTMEDAGHYECVLRTSNKCFKQTSVLVVNETKLGDCGRPNKAIQMLTVIANGHLSCPLFTYMSHADSYSLKWYKGCDLIQDGHKYKYVGQNKLLVQHVSPSDTGDYTCRVTFSLAGTVGHAAETIQCQVKEEWNLRPWMSEPVNETIKAHLGSPFSKTCKVFVPGQGNHMVLVYWYDEFDLISTDASNRVHQTHLSKVKGENGEWVQALLNFTAVKEEDFNHTYLCVVISDRDFITGNFTLQPSDPDLRLPLVILFTGLVLAFFVGVAAYRTLKIDVVLCCRNSFPYLYTGSGADGKVYDAYVVYPRMSEGGSCRSAEAFALHTLPHVLERMSIVDSVQENMAKSRRLLLLYTASTFSESGSALLFEQQAGTHSALVEGTIRVILVELEEVTDYSLFPESVLHLRRKQGAIRWWKRRGGRREGSALCPSSRFWKQVRYNMPLRGGPAACLEKNSLLNL